MYTIFKFSFKKFHTWPPSLVENQSPKTQKIRGHLTYICGWRPSCKTKITFY